MMKAAIILLALALTEGCAARAGSSGQAQFIQGPPGYDCFGIYDGDHLVAGNCVKN
jgi:hypothetical protein